MTRRVTEQRDRSREVMQWGEREPYVDATTVAAIQNVFNRTRLSHQGWEAGQVYGRLDARNAWRSDAIGAKDIFRDRRTASPTILNVAILVDASGSMQGERACRAQDMAGTLVRAFQRIPTVKLSVWQHNATRSVAIYRNYERGSANRLNQMLTHIDGGNADGFALEFIGQRLLKVARRDEVNLVIVISDGLPSQKGNGAVPGTNIVDHSTLVATELRRKGCQVMSVAIAGDTTTHRLMYGEGNVVPFTNDWGKLSRDFASVFGRVIAGRDRATAHR